MRSVLLLLPVWAWIAFEITLAVRDVIRRKGSTVHDKGTRVGIAVGLLVAFGGALLAWRLLSSGAAWTMGGWHVLAGELIGWAGLAIRIWAVVVLGASFRLTVEVDSGQTVVDRGPYRWVRHPSYTGLLLIAIGFGFGLGNWLSLAILVLVPPIGIVRRIAVEEQQLVAVLGRPYADYRRRTKRLIPRVW